jgi:hypothetical protein
MSRHGVHGPDDAAWEPHRARGKVVTITAHALQGMEGERRRIRVEDAIRTLEDPDHDDGKEARRWCGWRTTKVYYVEEEGRIYIRGVSATRRRFRV